MVILDTRADSSVASVCVCVFSELEGTELLVHVEDVVIELGGEQQVLQRPHVLLDGDVVLWDGRRHTGTLHIHVQCSVQKKK